MTENYREQPTGPFRVGDKVQLTGPKDRLYTITLIEGGSFGTHRGDIMHDEIIGKPDGSVISNQAGVEYLAFRPLLTDFVLSMPRGAAIVYPKDAANIVTMGDIFPGAGVVEAGVGSGALSMYLLRAIGPEGHLTSFERREEFAEIAQANVSTHFGIRPTNWDVRLGSLEEELSKHVTQLSRVAEEIRSSNLYAEPEAFESLVRGWHLQGLAVRPEHRMGGHTGFLLAARRLAPGAQLPSFSRRNKPEFEDEDIAIWNPEHVGERTISEKKLRKSLRSAKSSAEATLRGFEENGE